LKSIQLSLADNEWPPVLPDSFLGGFAPCLRSLDLCGISFPVPQKLLLSTTDLVTLCLEDIPDSGYISPDGMATCLSMLTKLKHVALGFRYTQSVLYQTSQSTPPLTRIICPALTSLRFRGDCKYLEALVFQIEAPLLDIVDVTLFSQPRFTPPLLSEFISRIESFDALDRVDIAFKKDFVAITLSRPGGLADSRTLKFGILCSGRYVQLSSLSKLCHVSLPSLPLLEHLHLGLFYLYHGPFTYSHNFFWRQLLRPFMSVKNLYVSKNLALWVANALSVGASAVLPSLQHISLQGPQQYETTSAFRTFISARGLSGHSVSVHYQQEGN
jgi:hypothetical protein